MAVKFLDGITVDGDVGIGTTNPAYKLSVESSLSVFSSGDTANPKIEGHLLRVTDTANDNPDIEHRFVENHSLNYGFSWFMDGGNNNFSLRRHDNSANGTTVFRVNRSNDTAYLAGNVGIGTTAPVEKLDVHGNIKVTGVGNGLNLDTLGSTNSNGVKVINNYETVVYSGRGSAGFGVFGNQQIRLGFGNGATTSNADLLINSSGNVGIGTISPTSKLQVDGTFTSTGISNIGSGANTSVYLTASSGTGKVGVGTTSPAEKLDVNGNVKASGYKTSSGTGVTTNVTVRNQNNSGTKTFQIVGGIIVGIT